MEPFMILSCPHCESSVIVASSEINCGIFRHGVYKSTFQPIDPHLPKNQCDQLVQSDKIYGCGKPFRIRKTNEETIIEICDYL